MHGQSSYIRKAVQREIVTLAETTRGSYDHCRQISHSKDGTCKRTASLDDDVYQGKIVTAYDSPSEDADGYRFLGKRAAKARNSEAKGVWVS
jgi:hypothetical protein